MRDVPEARYRNTGSRQVSDRYLNLYRNSGDRWLLSVPYTRRVEKISSFRLAVSRDDNIAHCRVILCTCAWAYILRSSNMIYARTRAGI